LLFSIGGLPLRVLLGFFARSSYRFRRSLKHRLLASQIAAKLLLGSEDRHPDRRKLPFQCARDLGVTHLFVVARAAPSIFRATESTAPPTSSCSSLRRTWESSEGVEWSGTSIRSVPSTHAPFSRFLCSSLSMQCRPVTFDTQGRKGNASSLVSRTLCSFKKTSAAASSVSSGCRKKRRQIRKTWR